MTAATITPLNAGCVSHPALRLADRVLHEASTVPRDWVTSYGDYQSGGWETLSLVNATGDPADVTISANSAPVRTTLLERMPATAAMLDELGLDVWWARLALMQPDSCLWEHRDYTEPGIEDAEQHRIHLPLATSSAAYLVTAGHALHMSTGRLWRINPSAAHGAVNLSGPPRLHLILDCHDSAALAGLRAAEQLPPACVRAFPRATPDELAKAARDAEVLARHTWVADAEKSLLGLYFKRALPADGYAYDMISEMHTATGDPEAAAGWQARKFLTLGGAR